MADAAEGVIASIAAAGGDDEVVFAAGYWITKDDFAPRPKDDFGGYGVAFRAKRGRNMI